MTMLPVILSSNTNTQIMGIVNVTPDSFSGDGVAMDVSAARQQALQMIQDGAAIIDIGGESTRPGAKAVSVDEECSRVIPLIESLRQDSDVCISIDSQKPGVMQAAIDAGANMINDVMALQADGALEVASQFDGPICLMHMQGAPDTMQDAPSYDDVVTDVYCFLEQRIAACEAAGIASKRLLVDPGFGFGKMPEHNRLLVKHLNRFTELGCAVLLGVSRKSTIGHVLDADVDQRLAGSLALAVLAVTKGARVIRTHDVRDTVDAIRITEWMNNES
jgi:dihydropteroate synthase